MTLEKAIKTLEKEYAKAEKQPFVTNPLAYALYQVWKIADEESEDGRNEKKLH